jgi:hypothetical protein
MEGHCQKQQDEIQEKAIQHSSPPSSDEDSDIEALGVSPVASTSAGRLMKAKAEKGKAKVKAEKKVVAGSSSLSEMKEHDLNQAHSVKRHTLAAIKDHHTERSRIDHKMSLEQIAVHDDILPHILTHIQQPVMIRPAAFERFTAQDGILSSIAANLDKLSVHVATTKKAVGKLKKACPHVAVATGRGRSPQSDSSVMQ